MLCYLHIPFCQSKCNYCAFFSTTNQNELQKPYFKACNTQFLHEASKNNLQKNSIKTLFIGGGTPSMIDPKLYEEFFKNITPFLNKNAEVSIEANPNSASFEWLKAMKNYPINRISFGVQSFHDKKLRFLGRLHSKKEAIKAVENAKKLRFGTISIDLIYSTMQDDLKSIEEELNIALSLPVDHISAYSLSLEKNTPFFKTPWVQKDDENVAKRLIEFLNENGLTQYEISNFGKICKHNFGYWQYKNYLGIGAGAVGFIEKNRLYPHENIKKYIYDPLFKKIENLSEDDIVLEKLFLGFRSKVGVDENLIKDNPKLNYLSDKISLKNGRFYANDFLLADEIVLFLLS